MGSCFCCGEYTVVHGNEVAGVLLCDRCCPCYNHGPPLGEYFEAGKYFTFTMVETWTRGNMVGLFDG